MLHALLIAPLVAPLYATTADDFTPKCEEGQVISRMISFDSDFELIESSVIQDGEEIPAEMQPQMTRTTSMSGEVECVETVSAVADGRPTAFSRLYVSAAGSFQLDMEMDGEMAMDPVSESDDFESDVQDETVLVKRGGDDEPEWAVKPEEGSSLDEDDAAELRADYSFDFLLPDDAAEEGGTWSVDVARLGDLLDPIGDLPHSDEGEEMGPMPDDEGEPEYTGTITATHAGSREVDGVELTVVKLAFDCESEHSFEPNMDEMAEGGGGGEGFELVSLEVQIAEVVDGEGEFLFDPAKGFIAKIELELSVERTKTELVTLDIEGMGELEIEQTEVDGGTMAIAVDSSVE